LKSRRKEAQIKSISTIDERVGRKSEEIGWTEHKVHREKLDISVPSTVAIPATPASHCLAGSCDIMLPGFESF